MSIDIDHFSELIKTENIKAIILVSVLGLVPQMDIIKTICDDNDIILLEDVCESFGSEYKGKKLGTYGLMSTYSTYFGHHLSTIEGGMVCTNDSSVYNVMKSLRSHGWDRDMDEDYQKIHREEFGVTDDFDSLYKFYYFGYNFRSTDLQAFLGIRQLNKAKDIIYLRNRNYESYKNRISDDLWKPKVTSDSFVSNFAYPIIHKDRDLIVSNLQDMNVEVRPLICGSLGRQPFWIKKYGISKLPNVDYVDRCGLYLPNNHQLIESEIEIICDIINGS
jgi:CDP-6-deoxy-D-xylo-4-hexulose-3-dehydrase